MKKLFLSESLPKKDSGRKQICRVMKLTASFLLLCSCFAFAGHANSQNAKVSLNKTKVQLQEILNEIEEQTDYLFISNRDVNLKQKVSVSAKDESFQETFLLHPDSIPFNIPFSRSQSNPDSSSLTRSIYIIHCPFFLIYI